MAIDLNYIRNNYEKAVYSETLCRALIEELSVSESKPIYIAYLGAFQSIWATHTSNPFNKLNTFNKGKSNIEQAVKAEPNNVEIRFIRYSIQIKTPLLLNYNGNTVEDKKFIKENLKTINSPVLLEYIKKVIY